MAASLFKKYPIDIHTGGVDLKFPHHDNEIA
jgi:cysteinyl-tRNA synthetase